MLLKRKFYVQENNKKQCVNSNDTITRHNSPPKIGFNFKSDQH